MRRTVSSVVLVLLATTLVALGGSAIAAGRYVVTTTTSATRLDVGQTLTLQGTVSPNAKGKVVWIQVKPEGASSWTTIKRPVLSKKSRYVAVVKVTKAGMNQYRVVKPRSKGHPAGTSPTRTVVGWRWRPITGMQVRESVNASTLASGLLGPATYRPYLKLGSESAAYGYVVYVLNGACTKFDAHVGVTDDSDSTAQQTAYLAGSTPETPTSYFLMSEEFVFRGHDPVHVVRGPDSIAGLNALQLSGQPTAGTYVAWGSPFVYCRS